VDRSDYSAVLAHVELELSGTEVRDREHQIELLRRDINHADHHYIPGVYQDIVSVTNRGRRSGTRTYIQETIDNGYPLTLSTHSLATRVLFKNGKGEDSGDVEPTAYGVEYMVGESLYAADQRYDPEQKGELRTVTAQKEVILSAGAFNTPQLLKLSGVGPREELEQWDIPVVVDLPGVVSHLFPCTP
jgi:choline dehydrogenase